MRRCVLRPRAAFDLESIIVYFAGVLHQKERATYLYEKINGSLERLSEMPTLGRPFQDELLHGSNYRWWSVEHYRIVFSFDDEELVVWRVLHERHNLDDFAFVDFD